MTTKTKAANEPIPRSALKRFRLGNNWDYLIFVIPVVLYFLIFCYGPMYGVQLAFKRFNPILGIMDSPWIGFDNFERLFNSFQFYRIVKNTLVINLFKTLISFPIPILLALMFNEMRKERLKKTLQTITYAPYFISTVVFVGIIHLFLGGENGYLNHLLGMIGLDAIPFLTSPDYFAGVYIGSDIWRNSGWNSIIFIAALAAVDPQLHESAQIDGASRWKRMIHVNLPCIMPVIVIQFILLMGKMMTLSYERILLMQNSLNMEASEVISTYAYKTGLINMDYGFSTAVGLFNNVINIALLLAANKLAKRYSSSSLF
ncbi:putative aldouronate transport system permease protein [Paenibacillus sp. UNCCL117]|uniref:ABC transporter permease n=1 Tax=unclassified Paenibacillus TaxID=185978 RepID=UPI00088325AE|nr:MULTISPECIES: ABC transporter permease subunit [unclassified Paenibacillus]SDE11192.1 putative aldouronate transport system permease protein [Paenibacillus sp. cl123]SFW59942.1 putative aldouronate transport system permease protein [Paenibacillus sp. UNCCL117]